MPSTALAIIAGVALVLAQAGAGAAVSPDSVFVEDFTWTELRDFVQAGGTTIVLPTGGTEQNGPHMAVGKHQAGQRAVAARLNREWAGTPVSVHAIDDDYRASTDGFREILRARGYADAEIGIHAGLADTSLMLAIDPRLVRADRLAREPGAPARDGVEGDPRRSSAELGRLGVDAIVSRTVQAIQRAIAHR